MSDPTVNDSFAICVPAQPDLMEWISLIVNEYYYVKLDLDTTLTIGVDVDVYVGKTFVFNNIICFKQNFKVTLINNSSERTTSSCAFLGTYKPS